MNGFYILAHDHNKLEKTLDIVNNALKDLEVNHQSKILNKYSNSKILFCIHIDDQFYSDSYGSGVLLRGVLLRFLKKYDKSHQAFDEIINMLVLILSRIILLYNFFRSKQFDEKSLLPPNALLEKAMVYIDLKQKQKANEYLQKSM